MATVVVRKKKSRGPKEQKRVRFEADLDTPRKRQRVASEALERMEKQPSPATTTSAYVQRVVSNGIDRIVNELIDARPNRSDFTLGGFQAPQVDVKSIDLENDWFESMHSYVSCKATPVHVIGIQPDGTRTRCEGVDNLDTVLAKGEVNILFHPRVSFEPVCETCWTLSTQTEGSVRMPGGWPREHEAAGSTHTHIFTIAYTGCKLYKTEEDEGHSLRLVKGSESKGGAGSYCRCGNGGSEPSDLVNGQQCLKTKISMPKFVGCPACAGKSLAAYVRRHKIPDS